MEPFLVLLKQISVHLEVAENQWGSGVLFTLSESAQKQKWVVLTCKHNLCQKESPCEPSTCGKDCQFVAPPELIRVRIKDREHHASEIKLSSTYDFALLELPQEENTNKLFTMNIGNIPSIQLDQAIYFRGFPSAINDSGTVENSHLFRGNIADIDEENHRITLDGVQVGEINDVKGISGSGVFRQSTATVFDLIGLVTEYVEGLKCFYALNPFQLLSTEFGIPLEASAIEYNQTLYEKKGIDEMDKMQLMKEAENLKAQIEQLEARIQLSFNPQPLLSKKEELVAQLKDIQKRL